LLTAQSDVVVENLRPGSMCKMGLWQKDMRAIHPKLIWATISRFGRNEDYRGLYSDLPTFDIVAKFMSGIMNLVGFADKPQSWTIYGMADVVYSGQVTAYGIMQALFMRERTGEGQFVDSTMLDNMLTLNESMIALHSVSGPNPQRGVFKNLWPRGAYQTKNGYIALNVPDNIIWSRLCEAMGHPELTTDERASSGLARSKSIDCLQPILENWLSTVYCDEAVDILNSVGVPCGPVNDADGEATDPHIKARGSIMDIEDSDVGTYGFARSVPMLSSAPELWKDLSPNLGKHSREILEGLFRISSDDVTSLAKQKVIQVTN
jgi:CoA:oxalate CoA-transferase